MSSFHRSVLFKEVLDLLQVNNGKKYIDATLGGGGHTKEILEKGGIVLGIDQDQEAITQVSEVLKNEIEKKKLVLGKGNFRDIENIARLKNFSKVCGVLYDLGVSSHQIDDPKRGFSFLKDGPLDMRMDKSSNLNAETLVNLLGKGELNDIFSRFGQERRSRTVSSGIVGSRRVKAIKTTGELSEIIQEAYGIKGKMVSDFAKSEINKRVFQALRIAVNDELGSLSESLPKALDLLEKGGRIVAISFHSLEDRIVKNKFKEFEQNNMGKILTEKPMLPTKEEASENPRSKSAKLRAFEKF